MALITDYPMVHPLRPVSVGSEMKQIVQGQGIYVQDVDGKTYIDGISGLWNVSLGYSHPSLCEALIRQLNAIPYVSLVDNNNPTTYEFARQLVELTPDTLTKVVFTCTGSESVETAIKIARKYFALKGKSSKKKFVTLNVSYHGTYYGTMSASGIDQVISEDYGPKVPGFLFVNTPFCHCCRSGQMSAECQVPFIEEVEKLFEREGSNLAAIILEPIVGSGGILPLPLLYLQRIQQLCRKHDVLIVFDEVATGFGRTGSMFAYERLGITPDLLCLSKGINSGYLPLGAVLYSQEINKVFLEKNCHIEHLSTQNGNPLACAVGLATLEVLKRDNLCEHVEKMGQLLRDELEKSLCTHRNFVEVRGSGLMIGIALVKNKMSQELLSGADIVNLTHRLRQKGLLVYSFYTESLTSGITLMPPFIVGEEEIRKIASIIKQTMSRMIF